MSIYEEAFAKSNKTDAILVVTKKKMHVNKAILSFHSDYFDKLFNSDFKEKSMEEVPIEDVNFEDFATLLSLVHETPLPITKNRMENLLKLADGFLLQNPKEHLERFIATSKEFQRKDILKLADKYKLEKLLKSAIDSYQSKNDYCDFYNPEDRELSSDVKALLFDKFFNRYGNSLH